MRWRAGGRRRRIAEQDAGASGEMEPIFFEFAESELGSFPACDDHPMPAGCEFGEVMTDDFTETAAGLIALDGDADFFAGDEAKFEITESIDSERGEDQGAAAEGASLCAKPCEISRLVEPKSRRQAHVGTRMMAQRPPA